MSADEGRHLVSNFSEVNRNQDFFTYCAKQNCDSIVKFVKQYNY